MELKANDIANSAESILNWLGRYVRDVSPASNLCLDSRQVQTGDVFFAVSGTQTNGAVYIQQALERGAAAVVVDADIDVKTIDVKTQALITVPFLSVPNLRRYLGEVAHIWYGRPSQRLLIVAVTGTNGKTSCVNWLAQALNNLAVPCATIGTLGTILPNGERFNEGLTTPDVLTLHWCLAKLLDMGIKVVALEASSIGLEQGRLDAVEIDIAAFTNLTHDHLDYHQTFSAYEEAKALLFTRPGLKAAVLNIQDPAGLRMQALCSCPVITYGIQDESAQNSAQKPNTSPTNLATNIHYQDNHLCFDLTTSLVDKSGPTTVKAPGLGLHNISNWLLVAGVLMALDSNLDLDLKLNSATLGNIIAGLGTVDGRLEKVTSCLNNSNQAPLVVVDYAHTPDALQQALQALSPLTRSRRGKLVCVFGCGGNRDKTKRPLMGVIAQELSDVVWVTSDNPRDEVPASILQDIQAGMNPDFDFYLFEDRAYAILRAVLQAQPEDVILIAGKGHETYQEAQGQKSFFDDRHWARLALTYKSGAVVNTDSRQEVANALFVALEGDNFDGHDYVANLNPKLNCAALVSRVQSANIAQIVVPNTLHALQLLSMAWRDVWDALGAQKNIIGVVGSNGKTTTKEMVASVLRHKYGYADVYAPAWLATSGNLNNHIGVPLTLLRLQPSHEVAVIEMGMNHPGEIALIAQLAKANICIMTNAQREHQEFMQSVEAVAHENGSAFAFIPPHGTAVYPNDEQYAYIWHQQSEHCQRITYCMNDAPAQVHATQIDFYTSGSNFSLQVANLGEVQITLHVPGLHNVRNAMSVASACVALGYDLDIIRAGLANFKAVQGRGQTLQIGALTVIDDTYNANPDSVRAAINVLARIKQSQGQSVALILGDMAEVGDNSAQVHAEVGAYAKQEGIDYLLALGSATTHSVQAFGTNAWHFGSVAVLTQYLKNLAVDAILVKGSRSMRMEQVIKQLNQEISI